MLFLAISTCDNMTSLSEHLCQFKNTATMRNKITFWWEQWIRSKAVLFWVLTGLKTRNRCPTVHGTNNDNTWQCWHMLQNVEISNDDDRTQQVNVLVESMSATNLCETFCSRCHEARTHRSLHQTRQESKTPAFHHLLFQVSIHRDYMIIFNSHEWFKNCSKMLELCIPRFI